MKICPQCQQTYPDENLNFCLNDGTVLQQSGGGSLPETIMVNAPRPTNPNPQFGGQPQPFGNQPQNTWNSPQQSQQPAAPPKSSKTWIWVVGILGFLFMLCGGGGLLGYLVYTSSDTPGNSTPYPGPSVSPTVSSNVTKYDMTIWKPGSDEYATTSYSNNKFTLKVTKPDYYYVLNTGTNPKTKTDFATQNIITRITVVNRQAKVSKLGFGLVIHSDKIPLVEDYAFVIDSENKRYRIIFHEDKIEKELTEWANSSAIKSGTEENVLEVRDEGRLLLFYINGQFITKVADEAKNTSGIAGIYSSGNTPIEFSNLQTEKK